MKIVKDSEVYVISKPTYVGKIMRSRELTTDIPLCICGSGKPACIKLWNENGRRCCFSCAPKEDAPTDSKEMA
jgi:hypothetical protein